MAWTQKFPKERLSWRWARFDPRDSPSPMQFEGRRRGGAEVLTHRGWEPLSSVVKDQGLEWWDKPIPMPRQRGARRST